MSPARGPGAPPVDDESALGEREAGEDPDREERDQAVRVAADGDEERAGQDRERPDPVREHLSIAAEREEVRQVVVAREQAREHRKSAEGGVRGEREDERDRERDDVVGPVATDGVAMIWLSTVWPERGPTCQRLASTASPSSIAPRITPSSSSVRLARTRARLFEQRHAVRDRLDAGERAAPGGEGLQARAAR